MIDPASLDAYLAHDGYQALRTALRQPPEEVIAAVTAARLRGHGGAGYPRNASGHSPASRRNPRNSHLQRRRGRPGTFMDRTMIEGDPHRLLEGMAIAAWAMGAHQGYMYVQAEYPLAVATLQRAGVPRASRRALLPGLRRLRS